MRRPSSGEETLKDTKRILSIRSQSSNRSKLAKSVRFKRVCVLSQKLSQSVSNGQYGQIRSSGFALWTLEMQINYLHSRCDSILSISALDLAEKIALLSAHALGDR